jgi:glycosyltransferase involved in cell wall biosynthesis
MSVPPKGYPLPWVGYLFDFQHHYFPEFFSKAEIQSRDKAFNQMLNTAKNIIVYGEEVIRDAEKFYSGHQAKLHALPFAPCPQPSWLLNNLNAREKYHIDTPYFLVSNQFWRHKDHATAFRAFGRYCESGGKADLVCTGATEDYRFPDYFSQLLQLIEKLNLGNRVKILGHISKLDQISLMRNSLAVLQPSLFEGGAGGGCSYDAISLGVPVIASDIPINKEMTCGDVTFFPVGNFEKLADILLAWGTSPYHQEANNVLLSKGIARKQLAGRALKNILIEAIRDGA